MSADKRRRVRLRRKLVYKIISRTYSIDNDLLQFWIAHKGYINYSPTGIRTHYTIPQMRAILEDLKDLEENLETYKAAYVLSGGTS